VTSRGPPNEDSCQVGVHSTKWFKRSLLTKDDNRKPCNGQQLTESFESGVLKRVSVGLKCAAY
jgi:hypothetical protein